MGKEYEKMLSYGKKTNNFSSTRDRLNMTAQDFYVVKDDDLPCYANNKYPNPPYRL